MSLINQLCRPTSWLDVDRVAHGGRMMEVRPIRNPATTALFVLTMVVAVVGVDVLFFRSKTWTWERLAANIGIVLLFGAFYFRFRTR